MASYKEHWHPVASRSHLIYFQFLFKRYLHTQQKLSHISVTFLSIQLILRSITGKQWWEQATWIHCTSAKKSKTRAGNNIQVFSRCQVLRVFFGLKWQYNEDLIQNYDLEEHPIHHSPSHRFLQTELTAKLKNHD